jgi:ferric-dicitrate binding protein FerR (iron transport regulator)
MTDERNPAPTEPSAAHGALRASDADRERTAAALRRHHLDGRLDTDELQERLGRCYAARTAAELAALLADLPADEPAPARPRRRHSGGGVPLFAVVLLVLAVAGTLAAVQHGHPGPLPLLAVFLLLRLGRGPRRHRTAGGTRV